MLGVFVVEVISWILEYYLETMFGETANVSPPQSQQNQVHLIEELKRVCSASFEF